MNLPSSTAETKSFGVILITLLPCSLSLSSLSAGPLSQSFAKGAALNLPKEEEEEETLAHSGCAMTESQVSPYNEFIDRFAPLVVFTCQF